MLSSCRLVQQQEDVIHGLLINRVLQMDTIGDDVSLTSSDTEMSEIDLSRARVSAPTSNGGTLVRLNTHATIIIIIIHSGRISGD